MPAEILPIDLVHSGAWAEIIEICGEPSWIGRMAELGMRIGSRVRVLQPGKPCLLQIGESRFSLRGDSSAHVLVRPLAG